MASSVLTLIDAPYGDGAAHPGCQMGPEALRIAGLSDNLETLGHKTRRKSLRLSEERDTAAWIGATARAAGSAFSAGELPLLIGGDHSLSAGSVIAAAAHWAAEGRPFFTLWIDAHGDFNTPATSPSGAAHGMALAAACGEPGLEHLLTETPSERLDPSKLLMLGLRSIDPGERRTLRNRGVNLVDMRHIDEKGVIAPLRAFLEKIDRQSGVLHVSFDIDALDPEIAPGVGTPSPGGLTYREAHLVMELLHDSRLVRSVDLMELNPFLDARGKTAHLMVELAASLFGRQIGDPR